LTALCGAQRNGVTDRNNLFKSIPYRSLDFQIL
jgi:hypothetical protein